MENLETLDQSQVFSLLVWHIEKLQRILFKHKIDKSEMTDVISKINELSLRLREFID